MDWLSGLWSALSGRSLLWAAVIFVVTSGGGLAAVMVFLVKLPASYFSDRNAPHPAGGPPTGLRAWARRAAKNVLGVVIFILGLFMALPGIPGPGLLIMLAGIMLADFPGKYRLERWLITRPGVLEKINKVRDRYGKPPMLLEGEPGNG